jgi:ribose transport system permease protein
VKLKSIKLNGNQLVLIVAQIIVVLVFSLINKNYFSNTNLINILTAAALVGLVAVGHTYLIIELENDLCPGSLCAFIGVLSTLMVTNWKMSIWAALPLCMIVGGAVGLFNAFMVNKIHIEAFIATLVTQAIIRGFAYIICNGIPIPISDPSFIWLGKSRMLGLPVSVWIMIVAFVIFGFILAKTKFGRSVYAIGGNPQAARLAGLNPQRIITISFFMMGVMCALGGVIYVARMQTGQPAANVNLEFDAITAVVLGGVSFSGGVGNMFGTVLGVLLIQSFNTGLTMVGVSSFWQYVARGALLLGALTTDYIRKTNADKKLLAESKKNG